MIGEDYLSVSLSDPEPPAPKEWYEKPAPLRCRLGFHRPSLWDQDGDKTQWRYCLLCQRSQKREVH